MGLAIIVVFDFGYAVEDFKKGIEKVSKVMMVALLALIIILAINSDAFKCGRRLELLSCSRFRKG